ncbi:MAG: ABC transporter permease [Dehalococcoidia bacterium]
MDLIWDGLRGALALMLRGDRDTLGIALRSLLISGAATVAGLAVGIPLGMVMALRSFRGRGLLLALFNTGMGMPPVVVGLVVALVLWRSGPLGGLGLLYTPAAMALAQALLAVPLVVGLTAAALQSLNPRLRLQIRALGASGPQTAWLLLREATASWGAGALIPAGNARVAGPRPSARHATTADWQRAARTGHPPALSSVSHRGRLDY